MQEIANNMYVLVLLGMLGVTLLAGGLVYFVVRYQHRLLRERLRAQQAELVHRQQLLFATIRSQEVERTRIGRDLHDEICGALSTLQLEYGRMQGGAGDRGERLHGQLKQIIDRTRTLSHQLLPPGLMLFGLAEAVEELADGVAAASQLPVTVINDGPRAIALLDKEKQLALFRIAQELLSNTVKHAGATAITIGFRQQGECLVMQYADNGSGLPPYQARQKGMGLHNIESRTAMLGGQCSFEGEAGKGFSLTIIVPV